MRYFVTAAGRRFTVELAGNDVLIDGRRVQAELREVAGTSVKHLLMDGRSYTIVAAESETKSGWDLHLDGYRLAVEAVDERTHAIRDMTGRAAGPRGPRSVRAPMPGLVVRVEVEPGQQVQPGQGVAVIEAMKMENELRAEGAGVVSRILVSAGQAVEKGAVLVEFQDE
jgi:pyruvate carboxylase subunit B